MLFWFSLAVFILAPLAGIAFAIGRGVSFWRDLRAFGGALGHALDELDARVSKLGATTEPDYERLHESVARLQRSRAQLSLLLSALTRVRAQAGGLLAVYPRK